MARRPLDVRRPAYAEDFVRTIVEVLSTVLAPSGPKEVDGQGASGFAPQCGFEHKVVSTNQGVPSSIPLRDNNYQHGNWHEAVQDTYGGYNSQQCSNSQQRGIACRGQGTDDNGKQGGYANGDYQHNNQRGDVQGGYANGDYQHDNQRGDVQGGYAYGDYQHDNQHGDVQVQGTYSGHNSQQRSINSVSDGGGFQHGNVRNTQGGGDSHGCGFHHGNGRNTQGIGDSQIEGDGRVSGGGRQQAECERFCQFQQGPVQMECGRRHVIIAREVAVADMEHRLRHVIIELGVCGMRMLRCATVFLLGVSGVNLGGWAKSRTTTTTSTFWSTKRLAHGPCLARVRAQAARRACMRPRLRGRSKQQSTTLPRFENATMWGNIKLKGDSLLSEAGSVRAAAESLWAAREQEGLNNLKGVEDEYLDTILHPDLLAYLRDVRWLHGAWAPANAGRQSFIPMPSAM